LVTKREPLGECSDTSAPHLNYTVPYHTLNDYTSLYSTVCYCAVLYNQLGNRSTDSPEMQIWAPLRVWLTL